MDPKAKLPLALSSHAVVNVHERESLGKRLMEYYLGLGEEL
jgi:hypothetical protein